MPVTIKSQLKFSPDIDLIVTGTVYIDGTSALIMTDANGERIAMGSVNANHMAKVAELTMANPNVVVIKDYSENEGMLKTLVEAKIVSIPVSTAQAQFVMFYICDIIHPDIIEEIRIINEGKE